MATVHPFGRPDVSLDPTQLPRNPFEGLGQEPGPAGPGGGSLTGVLNSPAFGQNPNVGFTPSDVLGRLSSNQEAWDAYGQERKKWDARNPFQKLLGGKAPVKPTEMPFEGDPTDTAALNEWYRGLLEKEAWDSSPLNPANLKGPGQWVGALADSAREDLTEGRRIIDENKALAGGFAQDVTAKTDKLTADTAAAMDPAKKRAELDAATGKVVADVATVRQQAQTQYSDAIGRFGKLEQFANAALAQGRSDSKDILNQFRDDTLQKMDLAHKGLVDSLAQEWEQLQAEDAAAGMGDQYGVQSSRKAQFALQTKQLLADNAMKFGVEYNRIRAERATELHGMDNNLAAAMGGMLAQGADTVAGVGKSVTQAYTQTADTIANVVKAGESEMTAHMANWSNAMNAVTTLAVNGQISAANMLMSTNQWLSETPFLNNMINTVFATQRLERENFYNDVGTGLSFMQTFLTMFGGVLPGPLGALGTMFGRPKTPTEGDYIGPTLGGGAAGMGVGVLGGLANPLSLIG